MMHRSARTPVGYIPTGTTNDFANSLHIPKGLLKAADNAVNGELFPCDVGKFNDDNPYILRHGKKHLAEILRLDV